MKIPAGWRLDVVGGALAGTQYGTSTPSSGAGSRPIVGMRNLANGVVSLSDLACVDEEAQDWSSLTLRLGDILLNRTNSPDLVGKVGIVRESTDAVFASYLVRLEPDLEQVVPDYLAYWLGSPMIQGRIRQLATRGVSQANINPSTLRQHCPLLLPPLPEQWKIAEILRTWDDATELAEAHIAALQARRGWLRTEVLTGRIRLSDHTGQWSKTPLRGVLSEHKQRSTGSEEVFSVSVHKGLVNQKMHLGRSFAAANTDRYNLVNPGDIVYTKSPTGDFPLGIVKRSSVSDAVIVSPLYGVFTPQNPDLGVILDAYFESPMTVQNYLRPLVQKGAKNTIAITNQGFLSGHLNLPCNPAEQSELAALLTASREEIAAAKRKVELLRTQKRGLMQKLLTGQVRVNVAAENDPGEHEDD